MTKLHHAPQPHEFEVCLDLFLFQARCASLGRLAQQGPLKINKTNFVLVQQRILLQMDELTQHQKDKLGDRDSAGRDD